MNQKAEIERMEAAFKRAADKAMNGTREERSGRFAAQSDSKRTLPAEPRTPQPRSVVDRKNNNR